MAESQSKRGNVKLHQCKLFTIQHQGFTRDFLVLDHFFGSALNSGQLQLMFLMIISKMLGSFTANGLHIHQEPVKSSLHGVIPQLFFMTSRAFKCY